MYEDNIVSRLRECIPHDLAPFEYNGLLTEKQEKEVKKIGVTLGLSQKSIAAAIKKNIDFLIVHNSPESLKYHYYKKIKKIAERKKLSIYRLHLPLDFMDRGLIDNLCTLLKLAGKPTNLVYEKNSIKGGVYMVEKEIALRTLLKYFSSIHPSTVRIVKGGRKIKKIAITTGDGCKPEFLMQLNPDIFICGLLNQESIRIANDLDITLIEATSYATENEPLKIFAKELRRIFTTLTVEFIDIRNDVEAIYVT